MKQFDRLVKVTSILRSPQGCPWDRSRNLTDLKRYFLEEAYELIDAINDYNYPRIKEELGDLIFLVLFIAKIAQEKEKFSIDEILENITGKLYRRHPHVFSSSGRKKKFSNKKELIRYWVNTKSKKKKRKNIRERIPNSAPALLSMMLFTKELKHIDTFKKEDIRRQTKEILFKQYNLPQETARLKDIFFFWGYGCPGNT
jgi:tetrapyrrole methylase family protein/MazG family protein